MALPKLWGKIFFFSHNFGNAIAEIVGEKIFFFPHNFGNAIDENVGKKKERIGEKNFPYLDYGNSIAENVKKKKKKRRKGLRQRDC